MSIKLNQTETALPRIGTKCQFCGRPITSEYVSCNGGAKGHIIYGHVECCEIGEYSKRLPDSYRKPTYSGFQWGTEFETNQSLTQEERLFLWANYKLYSTRDCTVTEELKSLRNQGLHGIKSYLEGVYKVVDIKSGDNVGTHCTVSLGHWDNDIARKFYNHRAELFGKIADRLYYANNDCIDIFGRYFKQYAEYSTVCFGHGYWLNIRNNGGLEFRIAKFQNVEQYSKMLFLLKEFCIILEKTFLVNPSSYTASKASEKMLKAIQKHVNKTATYFRSERNTKI